MKMKIWFSSLLAITTMGFVSTATADWGDLTLKFTLDGDAKLPALKADKDPGVCAVKPVPDESLVVGAQGELANVLVYLVPEKGAKVAVHTSYDTDKAAKIELDNKACRFTPHVATLRVGQTLVLKNSDPVGHNSKLDFLANAPQNPIIPGMSSVEIKATDISKTEKRASPVSCSIHPWMTGWVLIQDHPYMGVSDATGTVTIKNLPTGKWTFQVWQEKVGNISDKNTTDSTGKPVAWTKGKATIEIKAGANDLGSFKVKNS